MSNEDLAKELESQKKYFNEGEMNVDRVKRIVLNAPELREDALNFWKEAVKSDKLTKEETGSSIRGLVEVISKCPDKADDIFNFFSDIIKEKNETAYSLTGDLRALLKTNPEYADNVFSLYKEMATLPDVYGVLHNNIRYDMEGIAESNPELSEQAVDVLGVLYQTYKEKDDSLWLGNRACETLEKIACNNPEYANKAAQVVCENLFANKISREQAKQSLLQIAKANPETGILIGRTFYQTQLMSPSEKGDWNMLIDMYQYATNKPNIKDENVGYYKLSMKNDNAEYYDAYIKVSGGYVVEEVRNVRDTNMDYVKAIINDTNKDNQIFFPVVSAPYIVGKEFSETMVAGDELTVHAIPVSEKEYAMFKRKAKAQMQKHVPEEKYEMHSIPTEEKVNEDPLQEKMNKMKEKLAKHGLEIGKTGDSRSGEVMTYQRKTADIQIEVAKEMMKKKSKEK